MASRSDSSLGNKIKVVQGLPLIDRVMRRRSVNSETGCWEWTGALSRGYGIMFRGVGKSPYKVHRLSYELHVGPIPEGLVIRHRCDNPACFNPAHLEPGTQGDNARDCVARGRLNPASMLNLRPGAVGHHGAGPTSNKERASGVSQ